MSLVCNGRKPLISDGGLRDELILYNIPDSSVARVSALFWDLTGKPISPESRTRELSGGQKVLLMCLLALLSPAQNITFIDLDSSLDAKNRAAVRSLIGELGANKKIARIEGGHED